MKKEIEERFKELIDSDETIEKIEKPNACRFFVLQFLISFFAMLIISVCGMIEIVEYYGFKVIWAPCAISAFCILVYMLFALGYYKNIYYCITNKRVIIRSGIVGADYKAVNFKEVSKISVKKIWYDKLFKKKGTATIILGSLDDKSIEDSFDEMGALYRLCGLTFAHDVESLLKQLHEKANPKEETATSSWKTVKTANKKQPKNKEESVEKDDEEKEEKPSKSQKSQKSKSKKK